MSVMLRYIWMMFFWTAHLSSMVYISEENHFMGLPDEIIEKNRQFIKQHPSLSSEEKNRLLGRITIARIGRAPAALGLSPQGTLMAFAEMTRLSNGVIYLARVAQHTVHQEKEIYIQNAVVKALGFSYDNRYLAAVVARGVGKSDVLMMWDITLLDDGYPQLIRNVEIGSPLSAALISTVALSTCGQYCAVGRSFASSRTKSHGDEIILYDLRCKEKTFAYELELEHFLSCQSLSFSFNDEYLILNARRCLSRLVSSVLLSYDVQVLLQQTCWMAGGGVRQYDLLMLATTPTGTLPGYILGLPSTCFVQLPQLYAFSADGRLIAAQPKGSSCILVAASLVKTCPHEQLVRLISLRAGATCIDKQLTFEEQCLYEKIFGTNTCS